MKYTLISTMCLLAVFIAEGQKLSFPPNWYKGIGTPLIDECFIEGIPLNNGNFYLFSMQVQKPRNMVSGIWPTAAKLIKTDGNGVEICNFSVGTMSLNNVNSFRGIYSDIINGEIIFFVSEDSAIINKTPINKSVIIYHLDSQTLAYKHSDTLKYLFGKNVSIWNWFTNTIKESTFHALSTIDADGYFSSYCMKIKTDHGGYSIKLLDLDSAISLTNRGVTYVTNSYVDSCNFNVFMTSADTNLTASTVYRFISLDTIATIREFQQIYPEYYYFYEIGKYVNTDLFPQGHRLNKKKAIIGTGFSSNLQMGTNKVCGIMRYDLTTQHADKMLIMNDTTFSLSLKTYPNLNSLLYSGGSVWCAAFDFDDLTNAYLSNQENHIYVGKTDTSLNGWHWYKYIGKPNCYLVPYKILATPDGGCM
ncbi:MAG: hypothetical protein JST52_12040, partial [Bacteroidetes bacterium]|nr:hypothetical protein [Bacteroidota bacterium]